MQSTNHSIICPRPLRISNNNNRHRSNSITTNNQISLARKLSINNETSADVNSLSPELDEFFSILSGVGMNPYSRTSNSRNNNNNNNGGRSNNTTNHGRKRSSTGSMIYYRSRSSSGSHNFKAAPNSPPFPIYSPVSRYLTRNPLTRHEESSILAKLAAMAMNTDEDFELDPPSLDLSSDSLSFENSNDETREEEVESSSLRQTQDLLLEEGSK